MKKLSVFVLAVLLGSALMAQTQPKLGIKGGLNVATLNLEEDEDNESRLGLHAGLLAHIHLAPQWALQPEVVYSGQGTEIGDFKLKNDYINVPIMIQYMFDNGFRLEAGPQLGFLIKAKIEGNGAEVTNTEDYKKTDIGVGLGLGYLSYSGIGINARYNLGLTDINDADDITPASKIQNRVFQVGLFYMFDNSHKAKSR